MLLRGIVFGLILVMSWNQDFNFIILIVFENFRYGLEKKMAFITEKLNNRKSELESLLMLMEEREKTLKSLVRTLTLKLQIQESNRPIRMKHNEFYNLKDQNLVLSDTKKAVSDQYTKTSKTRHRIRLGKNTTFSWSYQKLP